MRDDKCNVIQDSFSWIDEFINLNGSSGHMLIHRDEINVNYIIQLLIKLKSQNKGDIEKTKREIANLLSTETTLRSKRELIERFIEENLPIITDIMECFQMKGSSDFITYRYPRYGRIQRVL